MESFIFLSSGSLSRSSVTVPQSRGTEEASPRDPELHPTVSILFSAWGVDEVPSLPDSSPTLCTAQQTGRIRGTLALLYPEFCPGHQSALGNSPPTLTPDKTSSSWPLIQSPIPFSPLSLSIAASVVRDISGRK